VINLRNKDGDSECLFFDDAGDYHGDAVIFGYNHVGETELRLVSGNARLPQTSLILNLENVDDLITTLQEVRIRLIEDQYGVKIKRE
jgi:hypothetical protein